MNPYEINPKPRTGSAAPIAAPDQTPKRPKPTGQTVGAPAVMPGPLGRYIAAPAIAAPPPAPKKPIAMTAFDGAAAANDVALAVPKGIADGINRTAVGMRNFVRQGLGKEPLEARPFNYRSTQDMLAGARAGNVATPVKPAITAPATAQAPKPTTVPATMPAAASVVPRVTAPQAPKPGDPNTFTYSNGRTVTVPPQQAQVGQGAAPSIAAPTSWTGPSLPNPRTQPGVASTYGHSVITMPDDNAVAPSTHTNAFRGPDAMAEHHRSVEDREARQRLTSEQDSRRFRLELIEAHGGRRGRAATEALSALGGQQASMASGAEQLSAGAVQGRAERDNKFAIAGMGEAGQDRRAALGAEVAREGQWLDAGIRSRAIDASLIERPTFITDDQRRFLRVGADGAVPVTDPSGAAIAMPGAEQRGQLTPEVVYNRLGDELDALLKSPAYGKEGDPGVEAHRARVDQLRQQIAIMEKSQSGAVRVATRAEYDKLPAGTRYLAPDGQIYTKPGR